MNSLSLHANNIINDESCIPVHDFWQEVLQKNKFNEKVVDKKHMQATIENLKSKMEQGPQTRQIIAAFRSIEHRDFNYLLMVSFQTSLDINRLDSGNHGTFDPTESISNLNSSVCTALKIISNDIKLVAIS